MYLPGKITYCHTKHNGGVMIKLSCKSCGAKLELTDDIDRFSCIHCGTEWLVQRGGGIASLKPVEEKLDHIKESSHNTAEHTEFLANEARLKRVRQRIKELKAMKGKIPRPPDKPNPKFKGYKTNLGCIGAATAIIIVGTILGYLPDSITNKPSCGDTCLNIGFILSVLFIMILIVSAIKNGTIDDDVPPFITDKAEMAKYNEMVRPIDDELRACESKEYDLEAKLKP